LAVIRIRRPDKEYGAYSKLTNLITTIYIMTFCIYKSLRSAEQPPVHSLRMKYIIYMSIDLDLET